MSERSASSPPASSPPASSPPASSPPVSSLQDTILRLLKFWAAKGCLLLPPYDCSVPFATLHPDAFFGVLDPRPWRAAFLQPVRRPLDGRYGEHPYRLGRHLQFQVVLKPPPANVQSLYLDSLECLGLDLKLHDVRFSEWQWRPRSIGGGGSGWHALLDGLGVTRLTFLERLADRDLDPACVEISYGLERLAMTLQGVADAFRVRWSEHDTGYGPARLRDENECSRYAFEVADTGELLHRLEALESEADRCLAVGLARPAYQLAVRCLEAVDLLEARGELSTRERRGWLERVCRRVVAAAELGLASPSGDADAPAKEKPSTRSAGQRKRDRPEAPEGRAAERSAAARAAAGGVDAAGDDDTGVASGGDIGDSATAGGARGRGDDKHASSEEGQTRP